MPTIQNTTTDQYLNQIEKGTAKKAPIVYLYLASHKDEAKAFKANHHIQTDVILLPIETIDQTATALATVLRERQYGTLILMDDFGDLRKTTIAELALNAFFLTRYA